MEYPINLYRYDLTKFEQLGAYSKLCGNFEREGRALQFSDYRPKFKKYENLEDCKFYRLDVVTYEAIFDWCEYPSEEGLRIGYYVGLPNGAARLLMQTPPAVRAAWLTYAAPAGRPLSALYQAVQWQHRTGCSQLSACKLFGASQSNFKITRERMLKKGELK